MDGFLNSVGRFLTSKSVGKKTPTVRIYKHVIFATGGARPESGEQALGIISFACLPGNDDGTLNERE